MTVSCSQSTYSCARDQLLCKGSKGRQLACKVDWLVSRGGVCRRVVLLIVPPGHT